MIKMFVNVKGFKDQSADTWSHSHKPCPKWHILCTFLWTYKVQSHVRPQVRV